jgi:uncharacterized protein YbbK (DUF523 family)
VAKYIVSACLIGLKTRYDDTDALCEHVRELVENGKAVPFCPEQAGGLPTPRTPAEITGGDGYAVLGDQADCCCWDIGDKPNLSDESEQPGRANTSNQTNRICYADQVNRGRVITGRVITKDGVDVTVNYLQGAKEMLKLARMVGATKAVLKAKSPSCGSGSIYDGTFSGNITRGDGAAAALLKLSGIEVMTEDDFVNAFKDD